MKELLSADELNDLLTAVSEGQGPSAPAAAEDRDRNIQPYDFRRPSCLSREHLQPLQRLNDRVATTLSSTLSDLLRTSIEAKVVAIELSIYGAFNASLSEPICLQPFRIAPAGSARDGGGEPRGVVTVDIPLAFGIIDRALGGQGQALAHHKPLTAIEQAVIAPILHAILGTFAAAWSGQAPLRFAPDDLSMSPKACQILAAQETILHIVFAVTGGACVGDLNLCLPHAWVQQLLPLEFAAGESVAAGPETRELLRRAVEAAPVRVAVELGRAHITVLELLNLRPGHVVRLGSRVGRPLEIAVEGLRRLAGQPGLVGSHRGVRITQTPAKGADRNG